jgi:hypothetical protein
MGIRLLLAVILTWAIPAGFAQSKKNPTTRSVSGMVTTADDKPVANAVVQIKDTKTKMVRSFSSQENGTYYFQGLSPDIDYEVTATYDGVSSPTRTVSNFDARKEVILNLKLPAKK